VPWEARQTPTTYTQSNVAYGTDPAQVMDIQSNTTYTNAPVVVLIHGGGWYQGYGHTEFGHDFKDTPAEQALLASWVKWVTGPHQPPANISATAGAGQAAQVGTAFAQPLVVTVTDANGFPVSGVSVTFTAPSSWAGGTFPGGQTTITATISGNGQVSESFTADTVAGSYAVTATVAGVGTGAAFGLANTAGAPAAITVTSGSGQSATVATGFALPLVATVTDQFGNPVAGASVTFTAPASGAGGTFSNGLATITAATAANGQASVTFTSNTLAGSYQVTATADGVSTAALFSLTNQAGPAALLSVVQGSGQSAKVNAAFAVPLEVLVTDKYGNAVSGVQVTFTAPTNGASGTFSGGVTSVSVTTTSSGVALAPTFTAGSKKGTYKVKASAKGLALVNFSLTNTR
jgi:hypothetical protein